VEFPVEDSVCKISRGVISISRECSNPLWFWNLPTREWHSCDRSGYTRCLL